MADYEVSFSGIEEFARKLDKIARMEDAQKVVQQHTARLAQLSSIAVPVQSGTLKRSMQTSITGNGLVGTVWFATDYAPYVEYGTRWFIGRRYLGSPFMIEKMRFLEDMRRLVR